MTRCFFSDEAGATAIEYGLICAGIALAILAALNTTGQMLVEKLTYLLNMLM
jgi:pilus assembly protein Flp/PilA